MDTNTIINAISTVWERIPDKPLLANIIILVVQISYLFDDQPVFFYFRGYSTVRGFLEFLTFWAVHNTTVRYMQPWHDTPTIDVVFRFLFMKLGFLYANRVSIPLANMNPPNNAGFLVGVEPNPGPPINPTDSDHSTTFTESDHEAQSGWLPTLSLDDETRTTIQYLGDSLLQAANTVSHTTVDVKSSSMDKIMEKVMSSLPGGEACHKLVIILTSIVLSVKGHKVDSSAYLCLKGAVVGYAYVTFPDDKRLVSCIIGCFALSAYVEFVDSASDSLKFEPQNGVDIVSTVITSIIGFVWYQSFSTDLSAKNAAKFFKTLGDLPKLSAGVSFFIDGVLVVLQKFLDFCTESFGCDSVLLKTSLFPELDALGEQFNSFVNKLRNGAPYNYDNAMYLFELEQRVNNMVQKIPNSKDYVEYKKTALALSASIKPLVTRMERNNIVGNGPRREPLGIMLGGPTGVGKSTSIIPLILAINSLVLPEEKLEGFLSNHNDYVWNFIPENPFFDSYHGQFNTIIDEAGAQLDAVGNPDQGALGALRMINGANFPLHMANLEDKGNTNFKSELVFATTNRTFFNWNSMYCTEAYCRRFRESYLVVPKLKYCKDPNPTNNDPWLRRLDISKIPVCAGGFCDDVNEFYPYDFRKSTAGITGQPYSFNEVIEKIAKAYRDNRDHADSLLSYHNDIKLKYMKQRQAMLKPQDGSDELSYESFADKFSEIYPFSPEIIGEVYGSFKGKLSSSAKCIELFASECKERLLTCLEPLGETWKSSLYSKLMNASPFFYGLAAAIPTLIVIWKFIGPTVFKSQSGDVRASRKISVRPGKAKSSKELRRVYKTTNHEQAGVNQNCLDVCNKLVNNNLYTLDVVLNRGLERLGFVLFTHGRCAMFPEHFTHCIESFIGDSDCGSNPVLSFKRVGALQTGFDVLWDDVCITYVEDTEDDINYMILPEVVPSQKDIRPFLCDSDELKVKNKFEGALLRPIDGGFALVTSMIFPIGNTAYGSFSLDKGFQYDISTKRGECGAPLFLVGQKNKPIIVGMHVAGNGKNGIATKVDKARVATAFDSIPFIKVDMDLEPQSTMVLGSNFLVDKEVAKLRVPFKNQQIKSRLHEAWGPSDYAPSLIREKIVGGVLVDPWLIARSKYSKHSSAVNTFLLDSVCSDTISTMIYESIDEDPWPHRIFTYEEAVAGIDGVDFVDGIPRSTSSGYPHSLDVKGKGKSDWFGYDGPYEFSSSKSLALRRDVEANVLRMEKLERVTSYYADYLKDERRPKAKVTAGKTRLISAASLDSLIGFKMYFGDLIRWLMQNRVRNSSAVGVNPYSHEWSHVAKHLLSVGDKCIFGDYSAYDGSLSPVFMYKFLDLADAFYSGSSVAERNVRYTLFEDIVNSKHVCSGSGQRSVVYEWFGSNPSGNLLTTLLNSFCNILIIKYSVATCWGNHNLVSHLKMDHNLVGQITSRFRTELRCIVFGDDNGICVSDEFSIFVDQKKLTSAMLEVGFTYTDEKKDLELEHTFRDISECSFLKRGFVKDKSKKYLAPLDIEVILEMCYWTKTNAPAGSLEQTVDTALMELSLHGEAIFSKYAPLITDGCIRLIQYRPNPSYVHNLNKAMHCEDSY